MEQREFRSALVQELNNNAVSYNAVSVSSEKHCLVNLLHLFTYSWCSAYGFLWWFKIKICWVPIENIYSRCIKNISKGFTAKVILGLPSLLSHLTSGSTDLRAFWITVNSQCASKIQVLNIEPDGESAP